MSPLTNITAPNGLAVGGNPISNSVVTTGQVFYVDSVTGSNTYKGTDPNHPLSTLDYAVGLCRASKGDTIVVMPLHAETLAGAGAVTCDIAGINIVGLGSGALRPTFTFSTTATTWLVTAANVSISNIITKTSVDSLVVAFTVSAAGCTLNRVDFVETASVQALIWLNTTAAGDDLTIQNCHHVQAAAGATKWIDLVGADRARLIDNFFDVDGSTHVLGGTTTASLNVLVKGNAFYQRANAASVIMLAASTGYFVGNRSFAPAKTALAGSFALADCGGAENYASNTVNTNGILDPVADT